MVALRNAYYFRVDQAYQDDLLQRVAVRAGQDAAEEGRPLRPPASKADLNQAEAQLGFRLHGLVRRLYGEVADGGFGPEYKLFPLTKAVSVTRAQAAEGVQDPGEGEQRYWPLEAVAILDWGCAMNAVVDCRSAAGTVLLVDPNAELPDRAEEWFVDSDSLEAWLESWLSGVNWYVAAERGDDFPQQEPWPDATARLSERA